MDAKEKAGRRAAEFVEDGMTLGLGTGSTVHFSLLRLAERIREEGLSVRGVPTSVDTQDKAQGLGIPLVGLEEAESLDLTIDGADEVDPDFHMIKGGGGALLREKVIASISRREVIAVVSAKLVDRLGRDFLLPVEVTPFALPVVSRALEALGCQPSMRMAEMDDPFETDNGNRILDCRFPDGIADAPGTERRIGMLPGVVESGLFIGLADVVVVGRAEGDCEILERGD